MTFMDARLLLETMFRLIFFSSPCSLPPTASIFHMGKDCKFSKPRKFKRSKEEGECSRGPLNKCLVPGHPIPTAITATSAPEPHSSRTWMSAKTLWGKFWIFFLDVM